jgi:ribose transport system permease protein
MSIDQNHAPTSTREGLPTSPSSRRGSLVPLHAVLRYGVFVVFVVMCVTFGILEPDTFLQTDTVRAIFVDASVLGVVAAALTLVLAVGDFDLSFGNIAGLSGAVAVYLMMSNGTGVLLAVALGLAAGLATGLVNGLVVAYGNVPALIATLAVGSMALGLERALMNDNTVYQGIQPDYYRLAGTEMFGLPSIALVSVVVVALLSLVASFTVFGRRIYMSGGGEEAARVAGIRTRRVRLATFAVMGTVAGVAGILLTSQATSYYPNSGGGLLLPAYAACFLGWSAAGGSRFYPLYTYFGVIFMGTLSTGLIIMQVPSWVTDLVQGLVLASAVLVARAAKR